MLVVMDPHRLLVDVRLERGVIVRQRWNFVGHSTLLEGDSPPGYSANIRSSASLAFDRVGSGTVMWL
jgi:hypothetical protein